MYQIAVTNVTKNRHSILPLVFAFLVGSFELIAGDISALKFIGTAERTSFGLDGKTIDIKFVGRFELDLDPSGKWLMTSFTDPAPNTRFRIGGDNDNKIVSLTYETATSLASVYSGNEFPFDLWPTDQFAWLIFASKQYQSDTNHLGRIGDLSKRLQFDPMGFALKIVPTFSSDWPPVLKQAEFFFDLRDYPKNPIGLAIPENEMDFKMVNGLWSQMRSKTSGVKVGSITSDLVKNFNGYTLPSRYKLEVTWRGKCVPDNAVGIDNLSELIVLNLVDVQRIGSVVGRPEFIGPGVLVKDYRFRYVNDDTVMEYLGYNIDDKQWKSSEDPILRMRAAHNRVNSPRFGNTRNRMVKTIGGVIIVLFFLLPLFLILKKIKSNYE